MSKIRVNNFKLKIAMIVFVLMLFVVQVGPFLIYADESQLGFSWTSFGLPCTNEYYNGEGLSFARARLDSYVGYCVDYGVPLPTNNGGKINYLRKASPILTSAMAYGYPFMTPAQLGVNSEEEAEFATQLAVWGVVNSSNPSDSQKTSRILDMNNLKPTPGYEAYMDRVKASARRIINRALSDPYYSNPKFYINPANSKVVVHPDYMLAGPYEIKALGFEISSINVSLQNAPAGTQIADANGNAKSTVNNGDNIYIKLPKTADGSELTINASTSGQTKIGKIYGTGVADATQDYSIITTEPIQLADSCKVKWQTLQGNIKVLKVDQYGDPVKGVKFELRNLDDSFVSEGTTTETGIIEFNNLKIGKYKLVEISAPAGYVIARDPYEFEITTGNTKEVTFRNQKTELSKIEVTKVDQNDNTIPGVVFELKTESGKLIYKGATDSNGYLLFDNLKAGKYVLQEISAPAGIEMKKDPITVEVPTNKTVKIKFPNQRVNGGFKIKKVDENDKPLENVVFELYNQDKKLIDTLKTDKEGIAQSNVALTVGNYYYKEISAPDNIIVDSTMYGFQIKTFDQVYTIKMVNKLKKGNLKIIKKTEDNKPLAGVTFQILDSNKKVIDTVTTGADGVVETKQLPEGKYYYKETKVPNGITLDSTEYEFTMGYKPIEKEIINKYSKGKLKILKVDENNIPLAGVTFEILDVNKKLVDTIATNEKGEALSKDLLVGTYYYKETKAPGNVVIDPKEYEFKLEKDNDVVIKNIVNKLARGRLKIIKTTEDKTPVANVKFQILNQAKEVIDTIVTGKDGIAQSKDLTAGKYYYREVEAPVNVIPDLTEHEFILEKDNEIVQKEVINKVVQGSLKIIKTDDNKAPLKDVKFEILNSEKQVIQTIVTNESGIAVSQKLTIGKYYYREVEAPDNVVIDKKEYEFKITENNQIIEKQIENKRIEGKLVIYKKDKDTKAPIEGVTFQVLNSQKQVIDSIVTDKNGETRIGGLLKGKYYFVEIDAPSDYIMDKTEYEFSIEKEMQTIQKTVYNEHKKLPVTGGFISTDMLIVIIISIITIGGYVVVKLILNRKKLNHNK